MLTTIDAADVARKCIRQATGFDGPIKPESILNTIGVVDGDAREAVNDDIVTDTKIGVQHFDHQLNADDLTFTDKSKFFELRDEIVDKAVPIPKKQAKRQMGKSTNRAKSRHGESKTTNESSEPDKA